MGAEIPEKLTLLKITSPEVQYNYQERILSLIQK